MAHFYFTGRKRWFENDSLERVPQEVSFILMSIARTHLYLATTSTGFRWYLYHLACKVDKRVSDMLCLALSAALDPLPRWAERSSAVPSALQNPSCLRRVAVNHLQLTPRPSGASSWKRVSLSISTLALPYRSRISSKRWECAYLLMDDFLDASSVLPNVQRRESESGWGAWTTKNSGWTVKENPRE